MRFVGLLAFAFFLSPLAAADTPKIVRGTAADGTRFYEHSLVIAAPAMTR